jgi:ubiquinone/menaquinone biosynthesis C-methylase UbiE
MIKYLFILLILPFIVFSRYEYTGHTLAYSKEFRNLTWDRIFLQTQVDILFPKELRRLKFYGLKDGMHVLDVGCGPAAFSIELLKHFPNLKVSCIDIDEEFISFAKREYTKYIRQQRLFVYTGSAFQLPFKENTFDFAVSRFLFQHLQKDKLGNNPRIQVSQEIKRVLKPGGVFVVVDSDDAYNDYLYPSFYEFEELQELADKRKSPQSLGSSGRNLFETLVWAGYQNVDEESIYVSSRSHKDGFSTFIPLITPYNYYSLVNEGIITKEKMEMIQKKFDRIFLNGRRKPRMMIVVFMAAGMKPDENEMYHMKDIPPSIVYDGFRQQCPAKLIF